MKMPLPLAVVALLAPPVLAAWQAPQLTRAQMEADLRQLANETEAKWAYAEDRRQRSGVTPKTLADTAIARLDGVHDRAAFFGLLHEFVAGLQDGHAYVKWSGDERLPFRRWPFTVIDTAEGLVIDEVLPTWTREPAAVVRGDLLLEVDGVSIAQRIAAAERRTSASTDGGRRRMALHSVWYNETDPARYRVRRSDGTETIVEAAAAGRHPEAEARARGIESRKLAADVACIRIPTFLFSDQKAWANASAGERPGLLEGDIAAIRDAFASAAGCKAIVLDLRGNGGGTDLLGMEVAGCLLPADSVYYKLASRGWFGWGKPSPQRLPVKGTPPLFGGQLVVLIDEGVFSTTDNLCRCLDDLHPDVTFVGRPTGGGTGAPRPCVTLTHSGAVITFCTMRVYGPAGELIEGRGTQPDVLVSRTRDDVLAGRDAELEAALLAVR
ncbi:MAG TPA: S41 family peptidase [Planctomycetota bacterium]|nr:S41 family peptidase [Planctomycetota bacterium]